MNQETVQNIAAKVIAALRKNREKRESEVPKIPLEEKHIQNSELLLNRQKLLEKMISGGVVAEIGVDEGNFSRLINDITSPAKLHLIDIWGTDRFHDGKYKAVKTYFSKKIENGSVLIHKKLSTQAANDFDDQYFDWIYIDTDHSYETTRDELVAYAPKMKKGGVIAGHDYRMGNWITTFRYGVIEAVHEFCVKHNWEILYLTIEPTESQSFAIRKL